MTLQQLLVEGAEQLKQAEVPDAELDARYLLMEAFGLSASDFLLRRMEPMDCESGVERETGESAGEIDGGTGELARELDGQAEKSAQAIAAYRDMIEKRSRRIPLQYITGVQYFMGLEFFVDERVLIPRQDTEDLVELVLRENPGKENRVLDMCTGSGCIAVSLAALGGYEQVTAVDVSEGAICVAQENAKRLSVSDRVRVVKSSLYEERAKILGSGGARYQVIVSNPPYIPTDVIKGLQPEVRDYEPSLALDGTADGLYFYRKLALDSREFLMPGGRLYLEIGYDQGEAVSSLLRDAGYTDIQVIKDTPGLDRIVKAGYKHDIGGSHV